MNAAVGFVCHSGWLTSLSGFIIVVVVIFIFIFFANIIIIILTKNKTRMIDKT